MLTLKLLTEEYDRVIEGLNKKHFKGAKEIIDNVLAVDKKRREAQQKADNVLAEQKKAAAEIGKLMKNGDAAGAQEVKNKVAELKEQSKEYEQIRTEAEEELTTLLCQIPNIPYDEMSLLY